MEACQKGQTCEHLEFNVLKWHVSYMSVNGYQAEQNRISDRKWVNLVVKTSLVQKVLRLFGPKSGIEWDVMLDLVISLFLCVRLKWWPS